MCPDCTALENDSTYAHPLLKWRMEAFDPIITQTLGDKIFEECTRCGERWTEERTEHRAPRPPRAKMA